MIASYGNSREMDGEIALNLTYQEGNRNAWQWVIIREREELSKLLDAGKSWSSMQTKTSLN